MPTITLFIIIALVVLALTLAGLEIFVIPGFGAAGIGSIACTVAAIVLIYENLGGLAACIAALVAVLVLFLMLWAVTRSRTLDKISLHATISSSSASAEQLSVVVGDEGVALTRLALIGRARIGGKEVEVKSAGEFLDAGTSLVVTHISEATITVEKKL